MSAKIIPFNPTSERTNSWVALSENSEAVNLSDPRTFIELCEMNVEDPYLHGLFTFIIDERLKYNQDGSEIGIHLLTANLKWASRLCEVIDTLLLGDPTLSEEDKMVIMTALFAERAFKQNRNDPNLHLRIEAATDRPDWMWAGYRLSNHLGLIEYSQIPLTGLPHRAEIMQCLSLIAQVEKLAGKSSAEIKTIPVFNYNILNLNLRVLGQVLDHGNPYHQALSTQIRGFHEKHGLTPKFLKFDPKG